jgi:hypothetical protein
MPDYGDILAFLAENPPQFDAERNLHASLLELLAQCLRTGERPQHIELSSGDIAEQLLPEQLLLHFN